MVDEIVQLAGFPVTQLVTRVTLELFIAAESGQTVDGLINCDCSQDVPCQIYRSTHGFMRIMFENLNFSLQIFGSSPHIKTETTLVVDIFNKTSTFLQEQ